MKYKAIVIGGSAGSFKEIVTILKNIPSDFNKPIFLGLHRLKHVRHGFVEALASKSSIPVIEPDDKQHIKPGIAYLSPANYHLLIELGYAFALSTEDMVRHSRPSIDLLFDTAANVYKEKLIGIILSGANRDGSHGLKRVKDYGGYTIVQDPEEAQVEYMPEAAIELSEVDGIMTTKEISRFINNIV